MRTGHPDGTHCGVCARELDTGERDAMDCGGDCYACVKREELGWEGEREEDDDGND